jgi:hypothetical protein
MKRLLLSLGLVGIAFSGNTTDLNRTQHIAAVATQQSERVATLALSRTVSAGEEQPNLQRLGVQRVALRSQDAGTPQADGLPEASVKQIFAPALPQAADADQGLNRDQYPSPSQDNAMWVVVTRGAWMHSGPSVAAPNVGHYSPGTELQLVGAQQGWFEVVDPTSNERGWILARYYLEPIDAPGQKRIVARTEPAAVAVTPAASAPSRPAPQPKRWVQASRLAPPDSPQPRERHVRRVGQGVGAILARALQR